MKGVVLTKAGHATENFTIRDDIDMPVPGPHEVLIKVHASALNPVDWKMAEMGFLISSFPVVLGCDTAGTIEALGPEVENYKVGDAVATYTPLGTPGYGTFQEFCLAKDSTLLTKSDNLTFEQASTLPVALFTASLALHYHQGIPAPKTDAKPSEDWFLVWGGSSAVGNFAVQLAKLAGFRVVATASPKNFDAVRAAGADEVVSYREATVVEDIRRITNNSLRLGFDAVGQVDETIACLSTAAPQTSRGEEASEAASRPRCFVTSCAGQPSSPVDPTSITFTHVMLGTVYTPGDEERARALKALSDLVPTFNELFATGALKPLRVLRVGGLDEVVKGLSLLKENKVSAEKVVVAL